MGGLVNYGNDKTGPRAKEYICTKPEELLELPAIDFTTGRIHEVLLACKELRKQGQHVVLQVSGPFTILNVLIDARYCLLYTSGDGVDLHPAGTGDHAADKNHGKEPEEE